MAGDFSTLTGISDSGYAASSTNPDALGLTNPDSVLSGTNRGIQNLGSPSLYADGGNNRIVAAPNQVPSVLMGNQPTFGNGFYVGKPGVNVITNTDASQFIFNSNQNVFKISQSKTLTVVLPVSGVSQYQKTSVAHGLGYIPAFLAYITPDSFLTSLLPTLSGYCPNPLIAFQEPATTGNLGALVHCLVTADALNIYFTVDMGLSIASTQTYTAKVYLLQETAI